MGVVCKKMALVIAGIVFSLVAALHFIRYHKAWVVMINDFSVPLDWSMYAGVVTILMAVCMFYAARK